MDFIDLKTQQKRIRKNLESRFSKILDHGGYIMGQEVYELVEPLETVEDHSKAKELLNWEPTHSVDSWIKKIKKDWRI